MLVKQAPLQLGLPCGRRTGPRRRHVRGPEATRETCHVQDGRVHLRAKAVALHCSAYRFAGQLLSHVRVERCLVFPLKRLHLIRRHLDLARQLAESQPQARLLRVGAQITRGYAFVEVVDLGGSFLRLGLEPGVSLPGCFELLREPLDWHVDGRRGRAHVSLPQPQLGHTNGATRCRGSLAGLRSRRLPQTLQTPRARFVNAPRRRLSAASAGPISRSTSSPVSPRWRAARRWRSALRAGPSGCVSPSAWAPVNASSGTLLARDPGPAIPTESIGVRNATFMMTEASTCRRSAASTGSRPRYSRTARASTAGSIPTGGLLAGIHASAGVGPAVRNNRLRAEQGRRADDTGEVRARASGCSRQQPPFRG